MIFPGLEQGPEQGPKRYREPNGIGLQAKKMQGPRAPGQKSWPSRLPTPQYPDLH